ncbi:MAG TPA: poly-gamma-glutamate system protein [Candidatus Cloacimonadota bacterium]|nr:poly-gamma-glutamate system protein [Candidatus Cloacimonadota bacterium]HQL14697.1 poly-gamma-glutamate system protein [Candidatus Cloacimonadota bacterium]
MYRPSLKSNRSLIGLFILSIILFAIAQYSYRNIQAEYYEEKLQAAQLMNRFIETIRTELKSSGFQFDPINDPYATGLIGTKLSTITTSKGVLSEKQTALNPNLAAAYIQQLKDAGVKEGDYVAVGITGSNPGANLALYAAMSVLKVKPVIITALSSSMFGANRDNFTWLDIESILKKHNLIDFSSAYASLGGREDLGIGLSDSGIQYLKDAMSRNHVPLLSSSNLQENIDLRMKAYQEMLPAGEKYKLFINIGGSLANVGSNVNARLIPEGINRKLAEKNFEQQGVMMFFAKKNIPVLHNLRILNLAQKYDLPIAPETLPKPGEGKIFSSRIHNTLITAICLFILVAAIVLVILFDRHDRHFMANLVDPDEEL